MRKDQSSKVLLDFPGEGLARSEWCDALGTERQLGRRLPGAALQRDPLPVARQAIEVRPVEACEGLESLQCAGLLEALGVHRQRQRRREASGAAARRLLLAHRMRRA